MPETPLHEAGWDARLGDWPRGHLLQSWGWGSLQSTVGWRAERLAVDAGSGRILPLLALVGGRAALALPPRIYVPKGPACEPDDTAAWAAGLARLEQLAARVGAARVTIEPNAWRGERQQLRRHLEGIAGARPVLTMQPAHTAIVDLRGGEDAVLSRMRPKGRYNVRLAQRRGVVIRTETDPGPGADALAALSAETAARQGISLPSRRYYRTLMGAVPTARLHLATVDDEVVAAALVACFGREAVYLFGGSTERHRERQPSALVHWTAMREAIAAGCERYDLWGMPPPGDPDHPWQGLRQFKLSLGGVEVEAAGAFGWVRRPLAARAGEVAAGLRRHASSARRRLRRPPPRATGRRSPGSGTG